MRYNQEAVCKTLRDPELFFILSGEDLGDPFSIGWRLLTNVHCHVKDLTLRHPHQLALRMFGLVMQTSQDVLRGLGVIILNELHITADGLLKFCVVKALKEKTTIVTKHLGLDEVDIRDGKWICFHLVDLLFKNVL